MPRKPQRKPTTRRSYDDDFKSEAVQMLLDGHSAQSICDRLGISGTNLLYRWKQQHLEAAGPVGDALDSRLKELEAELRRVERNKKNIHVFWIPALGCLERKSRSDFERLRDESVLQLCRRSGLR